MGLKCLLLEGSWSAAEWPRSLLHHGVMSLLLGFGTEKRLRLLNCLNQCAPQVDKRSLSSDSLGNFTIKQSDINISRCNARKGIAHRCFPCSL